MPDTPILSCGSCSFYRDANDRWIAISNCTGNCICYSFTLFKKKKGEPLEHEELVQIVAAVNKERGLTIKIPDPGTGMSVQVPCGEPVLTPGATSKRSAKPKTSTK